MNKWTITFLILCLNAFALTGDGSDNSPSSSAGSTPVTVKNATLPVGTQNTSYSTILGASGGNVPYKWSIVTGNLPSGLTLNKNGNIIGTPTAVGTYTVVFKVTDTSTPALTDHKPLQINVSTLVFTPGTSGAAMVHKPITVTVNASAPPPDGAALYTSLCSGCHGPRASSLKKGRNATQSQIAINGNVGGKQAITAIKALTPTEVSAIATALQ